VPRFPSIVRALDPKRARTARKQGLELYEAVVAIKEPHLDRQVPAGSGCSLACLHEKSGCKHEKGWLSHSGIVSGMALRRLQAW
jgi:hypothetical protein